MDCRLVLHAVFIVTFPTRSTRLAAGTAYGVFSTPVPFTVQTCLNLNRTRSLRSCREFDVIGVWNLNSSSNWTVTAASLRLSTTSTGVFGEISGTVGSFHPNIPIGRARLIPQLSVLLRSPQSLYVKTTPYLQVECHCLPILHHNGNHGNHCIISGSLTESD